MRTPKSLLTVAALAAALAAPSGALAQSAGDDQYTDPFQSEPAPQGQQEEPEAPAPAEPAPPADTSGQAAADAVPAQEAPAQLPRTGFAAVLAAAWGFVLLLGGVAIRRSV